MGTVFINDSTALDPIDSSLPEISQNGASRVENKSLLQEHIQHLLDDQMNKFGHVDIRKVLERKTQAAEGLNKLKLKMREEDKHHQLRATPRANILFAARLIQSRAEEDPSMQTTYKNLDKMPHLAH